MGATRNKKPRKPLLRAKGWLTAVPRRALHLAVLLLALVITGLIFSAFRPVGGGALRIAVSMLSIALLLYLNFGEGAARGTEDARQSIRCMRQLQKGGSPERKDLCRCYHPLKAVTAAALVYGVPLALAVYIALAAKPYTYTLQDLPTWLTATYGTRGDVMAPLSAYTQVTQSADVSIVRTFVRLIALVYVNLFGDPVRQAALIDRLSAAMILTFPISYLAGYLSGDGRARKLEAENKRAKKIAEKRAQKQEDLVAELLGAQNTVHYGQTQQGEKRKRKELI